MTQSAHPIVVLDFGSQYTQLIARRIREMQVYAVIVPCSIAFEALVRMGPQALIGLSTHSRDEPRSRRDAWLV